MVKDLMKAFVHDAFPREKMQVSKRQTRFTYTDGPMFYLGLQIVKMMQDAGYPAKISECYRSPDRQNKLYVQGTSKAKALQSPHQYLEAVDIIHPSKGWNVSHEYWDTLNACTLIIEDKFGVDLVTGYDWGWDKAHIELKDWRKAYPPVPFTPEWTPPTPARLWHRFEQVLPAVAKQHKRSTAWQKRRGS